MQKLTITLFSLSALMMSGCAVTTAGVTKGDERNMARAITDNNAGRAIKARMNRAVDFKLSKVDVEVAEGVVLLTGTAPTAADAAEAERIAWTGHGVVQVGNEISEPRKIGFLGGTKDSFLHSAIRSRMIADSKVKARNINIETDQGIVYLLGVVRSTEELERAAYIASSTKGTKEVISYLTFPKSYLRNANYQSAPASAYSGQSYSGQSHLGQSYSGQTHSSQGYTQSAPIQSVPSQRPLPQGLTTSPSGEFSAPGYSGVTPSAPSGETSGEAYFRDPKTGKRIELAPGTKTVPYMPGEGGGAAHYVHPDTGEKIPITYRRYF